MTLVVSVSLNRCGLRVCWFADDFRTRFAGGASLLSKPTAGASDTSFRQGRCALLSPEMIRNTVDQTASRTRPLGATMLHATARETHPVLRWNAVNLKRIQHLLRYRRIGCDVDNLTRLNDYSQQVRTWFRSRPGARRLSFVGFDTHGVDRMALGFRELRGDRRRRGPSCRHERRHSYSESRRTGVTGSLAAGFWIDGGGADSSGLRYLLTRSAKSPADRLRWPVVPAGSRIPGPLRREGPSPPGTSGYLSPALRITAQR